MKQGVTLATVMREIQEMEEHKRDWVVDTRALEMLPHAARDGRVNEPWLRFGGEFLRPNSICHSQIAQRLRIPGQYYQRMLTDQPDLLASNVNRWFQVQPERRLLRGIGSSARAFLSDRYRPRDNGLLLRSVLAVLDGSGRQLQFQSTKLTDSHFYLKVTFPDLTREVKPGDVVHGGIAISNSEVGLGQTEVTPLLFRLVCANGLIVEELASRKRHVGRVLGGGGDSEEPYEIWSQETIDLDEAAYVARLRDITMAALDETRFDSLVERCRGAAQDVGPLGPRAIVERVTPRCGFSDAEADGFLQHLLNGGDLSKWGVVNAVTRLSQDVESYDRATELERLGGRLLGQEYLLN